MRTSNRTRVVRPGSHVDELLSGVVARARSDLLSRTIHAYIHTLSLSFSSLWVSEDGTLWQWNERLTVFRVLSNETSRQTTAVDWEILIVPVFPRLRHSLHFAEWMKRDSTECLSMEKELSFRFVTPSPLFKLLAPHNYMFKSGKCV